MVEENYDGNRIGDRSKGNNEWDDYYLSTPLEKIPWQSDKPPESLIGLLDGIKPGKAFEACCGAGTNVIYLARRGWEVRGMDVSQKAIEIAGKRARDSGVHADLEVGDVLNDDIGKGYDLILDRGCFHHLADRQKYVERIARALKPGGTFLLHAFCEKNGSKRDIPVNEIRTLYSPYFDIISIEECSHVDPEGSRKYLNVVTMRKTKSPENND